MLLDQVISTPRLLEHDEIELAAPPETVWAVVRHSNLARSPWIRALFALRTLPSRVLGKTERVSFRLDDLVSSAEKPGFRVLLEEAPREVVVGAIGKVWSPDIPFVHVESAEEFAAFDRPDFIKVAWSMTISPRGTGCSRLEIEVRVDATDEEAWRKFRAYFRLIGPASRFIRRSIIASLTRELGTPEGVEPERSLAGDELLSDARDELTHGITINAPPSQIWPWLLQMGANRAGFYAIDWLDNGGKRSAREVHPDLMSVKIGDVIPAAPDSEDGFEVLRMEAPRVLVLGGLYDAERGRQLAFDAPRPEHFWHVTWAFVLEPLDAATTRLHVRARAAFSSERWAHATWIKPIHHMMESAQLRHLKRRAEGTLPRDDVHDVLSSVGGAGIAAAALLTPFLRSQRLHWGLSAELAACVHPGDRLIEEPLWSWTHGVEIEAPIEQVWPWIAQVGADRGGFYSYQWLENVAGCELSNAERVHPEWEVRLGDALRLHPKMPPLEVVDVERGRYFLAHARADERAREAGEPWAETTWLFMLEALGPRRCRFISRFRVRCSSDLASRLEYGPLMLEPIGFAMDRRMLLGVKARAEESFARLNPPAQNRGSHAAAHIRR